MCHYDPSLRHLKPPILFSSDIYPILFTTLFSLSNGYLSSLAMMYSPGLVSSPVEQLEVGAWQSFISSVGCLCGSLVAVAVT